MKQILWTGGLIVALSGAAAPALAHHSLQSEYDINQSITLKGTVTKVDWVNPHVYVYLDVKDDKGAVTKWAVTTLPPGNLRRGGLTRDLLAPARAQFFGAGLAPLQPSKPSQRNGVWIFSASSHARVKARPLPRTAAQ